MTTHSSGRRFGVRSVYTLAGEWGTGSHPLVLPSIDVFRQCTGFGKTMRLKASKKAVASDGEAADPQPRKKQRRAKGCKSRMTQDQRAAAQRAARHPG